MMTQMAWVGRFWAICLILNGVLAGSRWLIRPWEGIGPSSLNLLIISVVCAFFFVSAILLRASDSFERADLPDVLISAVGGLILMAWQSQLPLWTIWLWGFTFGAVLIPFLLWPTKQDWVLLSALILLCALFGQTFIGLPVSLWSVLAAMGLMLFLFWSWFRRIRPEAVGIYTAVALIAFFQIVVAAFFLPWSPTGILLGLSLVFGLINFGLSLSDIPQTV